MQNPLTNQVTAEQAWANINHCWTKKSTTTVSVQITAVWKVNNPKLAKVDADEKGRQKTLQADSNLMKAAGVEGMEKDSPNSIANKTNWANLADALKIERGVNNQGVNLLKKAYDQFDSNHNWRPEPDPNVCCGPRWRAAIKVAKAYIEKNYTVNGGNYFRKNADGSVGDDVSAVHGNTEQSHCNPDDKHGSKETGLE